MKRLHAHPLLHLFTLLVTVWLALTGTAPAAPAASKFAAIAYSPTTQRFGYTFGKPSRAAAEGAAIRLSKAADARVVVWSRDAWCALARSKKGNAWGVGIGTTKAAAQSGALRSCPSKAKYIAAVVFSGS